MGKNCGRHRAAVPHSGVGNTCGLGGTKVYWTETRPFYTAGSPFIYDIVHICTYGQVLHGGPAPPPFLLPCLTAMPATCVAAGTLIAGGVAISLRKLSGHAHDSYRS